MTLLHPPAFGMEFETPLHVRRVAVKSGNTSFPKTAASGLFLRRVAYLFPSYVTSDTSCFLSNSCRLYVDCQKPEFTTPEVNSPYDICLYINAIEQIAVKAMDSLMSDHQEITHISMGRHCIDYATGTNSWGCHESYLYSSTTLDAIAERFITHTITRMIYSGAGGFSPLITKGFDFTLSPRVTFFSNLTSDDTCSGRGIFNTRNESLQNNTGMVNYQRLHVICGDDLSSITSQWLKVATTALVLLMIEQKVFPSEFPRFVNPVVAIQSVAQDFNMTKDYDMSHGPRQTAIQIQRSFYRLACKLDVSDKSWPWISDCLQLWDHVLTRLEDNSRSLDRTLNWGMKLCLFERFIASRGYTPELLEQWTKIFRSRNSDLLPSNMTTGYIELIKRHDCDPNDALDIYSLACSLRELDILFGQLGPLGLYNVFDAQGHFDHLVSLNSDPIAAQTIAPSYGRPYLRGILIKNDNAKRGIKDRTMGWVKAVWTNPSSHVASILPNPFTYSSTTIHQDNPRNTVSLRRYLLLPFVKALSSQLCEYGDYRLSSTLLTAYRELHCKISNTPDYLALAAVPKSELGQISTNSALPFPQDADPTHEITLCHIYNSFGEYYTPFDPEKAQEHLMTLDNLRSLYNILIVAGDAYRSRSLPDLSIATTLYSYLLNNSCAYDLPPHSCARAMIDFATFLRLTAFESSRDQRMSLIDDAKKLQTNYGFIGDLHNGTMIEEAHCHIYQKQYAAAASLLENAYKYQQFIHNPLAMARIVALFAKLSPSIARDDYPAFSHVPCLHDLFCKLLSMLFNSTLHMLHDDWSHWLDSPWTRVDRFSKYI